MLGVGAQGRNVDNVLFIWVLTAAASVASEPPGERQESSKMLRIALLLVFALLINKFIISSGVS